MSIIQLILQVIAQLFDISSRAGGPEKLKDWLNHNVGVLEGIRQSLPAPWTPKEG